jgi:DNA-binding NtrC family response regulator
VLKHVLLLDDDPIQLKIREAILRSAGILVSIATTPDSALALMRTKIGQFGAVVTDHLLQGQTGADFVRELRTFNPDIPVLVLSGMAEIEGEYEGMHAEIRQKPLPPEELIRLVQQALG